MTLTAQQILDCPMGKNDAGAATVRGYLIELITLLWTEEEGFNSKRPFGNSGWCYEIYGALQEAGYLPDDLDVEDADEIITGAIKEAWA